MKKLILFIALGFLFFLAFLEIGKLNAMFAPPKPSGVAYEKPRPSKLQEGAVAEENAYLLYIDGELINSFDTFEEALKEGENHSKAIIKHKDKASVVWDNFPPYDVFYTTNDFLEFETFAEAIEFAKKHSRAFIYYRKDNSLIWTNVDEIKKSGKINNVNLILQKPELPRGCEVTSLAMLMNFKGISVSKMTLAKEIDKDETKFERKNGKIYYGNPNTGFVGDMERLENYGYGVYHKPIHRLLTTYLPYSSLDLTGTSFEDLLFFVNKGTPLWVIINTQYKPLPLSSFETWHTPAGEVKITYSEHSVLVTGYDESYIYFNDPLGEKDKAPRAEFIAAWEQMGSQAVTISY